jgi:acyl-CoA synthetase (AMP-forming)/AMP-acid ligase II
MSFCDLVSLLLAAGEHGDHRCFAFIPEPDAGRSPEVAGDITFSGLIDRALRLARGMVNAGLSPGDRVALFARPDVDYVTAVAATIFAGGVVAPVNHLFKQRELDAYLALIEPRIVIDARGFAELVANEPISPRCPDPMEPAFVMHTSGTTGLPKAVVRTHATYAQFASLWAHRYMQPGDGVLNFMPMYHQGGVMMSLLPAFVLGNPVYQLERFSPRTFWMAAEKFATRWAIFMPPVPSFLLLNDKPPTGAQPFRWAMTGGRVDHWAAFQQRFGIVGHSGYGSTETTMVTMTGDRGAGPAAGAILHGPRGGFACGRPIEGWNEVRVVTAEGRPARPLEEGHLEFRGPGVVTEYFGNPEATDAAFSDDGWFRTGDVGYIDDEGLLFMIDRSKDLIRRSGENISPREIEDVLQDHPAVKEAAVVPVDDELRGQEIRACVVLHDPQGASPAELFAHCEAHLSVFKVPRYLDLRTALPHTPTLKVKKEALLNEVAEGWVDRLAPKSSTIAGIDDIQGGD